MKIAVASGKGGTGKTTLAVSLARSLVDDGDAAHSPPLLLDCDVEAPDAHLFLHPEIERSVPAAIPVPRIDGDRCTLCGECAEVCQFNAIAVLGEEIRLFPELCHGCGSCTLICPEHAITEVPRKVGRLERGSGSGVRFAHGVLEVGEVLAVPVIRELKEWARPGREEIAILDAPPGTSCPMVETVTGSDFVILVTEPTPFGLHDLELAVDVLRELGLPAGVVVNRDGSEYEPLDTFCAGRDLPVLLRIPFERAIAEGIARGQTLLDVHPEYAADLRGMLESIQAAIAAGDPRTLQQAAGQGRRGS